jgi:structural maintenance of chromosome 3 (chondroitin sulfate proteoglycan 6)
LDAGAESVRELVEKLDQQKDEAINRTFWGVSAHFKDVFKDLMPNGAGELIMSTAIVEDSDDEEDDEDNNHYDDEGEEASQKKKKKKTKKKGKKKK